MPPRRAAWPTWKSKIHCSAAQCWDQTSLTIFRDSVQRELEASTTGTESVLGSDLALHRHVYRTAPSLNSLHFRKLEPMYYILCSEVLKQLISSIRQRVLSAVNFIQRVDEDVRQRKEEADANLVVLARETISSRFAGGY